MHIQVPSVIVFDRDLLLLVVPNSPYGDRLPLQLGTVQIDIMLDVATEDELQALGMSWIHGELATRLAGRQNEGVSNSFNLRFSSRRCEVNKECYNSTKGNKTSVLYH